MPENQTVPTKASVDKFLEDIDEGQRKDSYAIIDIMKKVTKEKPVMWGPAIIGFGSYHYKYESGREGDSPITAFSPRKGKIVIYATGIKQMPELMEKLGKYKLGGGCLYIKKLEDIDTKVLKELLTSSVKELKAKHKK